jgi:hypothetical protein
MTTIPVKTETQATAIPANNNGNPGNSNPGNGNPGKARNPGNSNPGNNNPERK